MALVKRILRLYQTRCLYRGIRTETNHFQNLKHSYRPTLYTTLEKYCLDVSTTSNLPKKMWEDFRNQAMQLAGNEQDIVDSVILQLFLQNGNADAGISYYKFLEENNLPLSPVHMEKYLKFHNAQELDESKKESVLKVCKQLIDKYSGMPEFLLKQVICSLLQLNELELAMEVIKRHENYLNSYIFTSTLEYLFANGHLKMANDFFSLYFNKYGMHSSQTYIIYLKYYCLENNELFNERVEKVFSMWSEYGLKPSIELLRHFLDACKKAGWSVKVTTMRKSECIVCKNSTTSNTLSLEEFEYLSKVGIKTIVNDNLFTKSSKTEMQKFDKFLRSQEPYDFVIDALNILKLFKIDMLASFINQLMKNDKRILVIGRRHIGNWKQIKLLKSKVDVFLVDNETNDDVFLLYAAFLSGNDCNIVTYDFLRQHRFRLADLKAQVLFKRWQMLHQYVCTANKDLTHLNSKKLVDSLTHKINDSWHIAYHESGTKGIKTLVTDDKWYCLRMKV